MMALLESPERTLGSLLPAVEGASEPALPVRSEPLRLASGEVLSVIAIVAPSPEPPGFETPSERGLPPTEAASLAIPEALLEGAVLLQGPDWWVLAEPVRLADWTGPEGEAHLGDLSWIGPRALRHARQVEAVSQRYPVFPLPLGTLFGSLERALERFSASETQIRGYLERVAHQVELGVRVSFNRARLEQQLVEAAMQEQGPSRAQGAGYLQRQRLARVASTQARGLLLELVDGLLEAVRPFCLDFKQLKRLHPDGEDKTWEQAGNFAFLLERVTLHAFEEALEQAAIPLKERCGRLEVTGPWAPYSFRPSLMDPS